MSSGLRSVLLGSPSTWRSERAVFECGRGKDLTLANRLEEDTTELATIPEARKARRRG